MNNDTLKYLLFDMLNGNRVFSDVSLDDETDTIFINSFDGKRFIVTVSPVTSDEALIELWAKKNSELMSLVLGVTYMRDLGVFTGEEADVYLAEIIKRADNSVIGDLLEKDR